MTIIESTVPAFRLVAQDLYKDIHKAIRAELFAVTAEAASLDPSDRTARLGVAQHVRTIGELLESHAHHEDSIIEPALRIHRPDLAELVRIDHDALEPRFERIVDLAALSGVAPAADQCRLTHLLQLELAAFTGTYLIHQDFEERVLMPALEDAVGLEAVVAMHVAIVGSIPPDEMARSLALMLPAMNAVDQAELVEGMRRSAPPNVVAGVLALAENVLGEARFAALLRRLDA